ncbi:hypothetical protein ES707_16038 [subsurface metagenome]
MKNSESIYFQGANSIATSGKITWKISMEDFQRGVVEGVYPSGDTEKDIRDTIGKIRTSGIEKEEYKKFKGTLPGICPQGHFKPAKGYPKGHRKGKCFESFTNVVVIDIDKKKNISKIKNQVIDQLAEFSYVIALSPGNNGLHVYLRTEIKKDADIAQVLKSVSQVIGMKVDPMTKDCTRYMYLTWDPLAHINKSPELYIVPASVAGTLLEPTDEFYDIENLMAKRGFLGKVRYTDNFIWKAFLILAKNFKREHVDKYLSTGERREKLFHPDSSTVNDLDKINTNLDKAYKAAEKWRSSFKDYFKTDNGIYREYKTVLGEKRIVPVNASLFRSLYGEDAIKSTRYYYAMESVPNNYPGREDVEFMNVPKEVYNLYEPLKHQPEKGEWDHIKIIFEHFTRDQTQYLYDYVKLLLTKPSQILPILVLISPEQQTGKTTMLNFLYELFNPNGHIISMLEFSSRFNSHYATKLLVAIDESKLDKKELEKIKSISTAKNIACEFKGRDAYQIRNYQHYILSSNSLDFAYHYKQETRFWCFIFPSIKKHIPGFYEKMMSEIPAFIYYLFYEHVMAEPESQSRAWFSNDVVTQYFKDVLYEETKQPDIDLLKDIAMKWFSVYLNDDEMRFMGQKVRRFFKNPMPISEFANILMNESWIHRYDKDTNMQYHSGLFEGTAEMDSQLPAMSEFSAPLSSRRDRRTGLFYIRREDLFNPDDDKDDEGNTQSQTKEDDCPF